MKMYLCQSLKGRKSYKKKVLKAVKGIFFQVPAAMLRIVLPDLSSVKVIEAPFLGEVLSKIF